MARREPTVRRKLWTKALECKGPLVGASVAPWRTGTQHWRKGRALEESLQGVRCSPKYLPNLSLPRLQTTLLSRCTWNQKKVIGQELREFLL